MRTLEFSSLFYICIYSLDTASSTPDVLSHSPLSQHFALLYHQLLWMPIVIFVYPKYKMYSHKNYKSIDLEHKF